MRASARRGSGRRERSASTARSVSGDPVFTTVRCSTPGAGRASSRAGRGYPGAMAYVTREAQEGMLADVATATDEIGAALAALGAAYEQLDEHTADRLEEELFRPVQAAYGRAKRTHAGFAERTGLPGRAFEPAVAGRAS